MEISIVMALYLMLPAYLANMAPVMAAQIPLLPNTPINTKLFGTNKTYRGFISGIFLAIVTVYMQQWLYQFPQFAEISLIRYDVHAGSYDLIQKIFPFALGFLFGFGTLFGDLCKSFIKRRLNKKPGTAWPPWDQIDFIIGALICITPLYQSSLNTIIIIILITPILHLLTNFIAYMIGWKKVWW